MSHDPAYICTSVFPTYASEAGLDDRGCKINQEPRPSRTTLLFERSGAAVDDPTWFAGGGLSKLCWPNITAYLGSFRNLGTESFTWSQLATKSRSDTYILTLDMSLKTEAWASLNRLTTSCRLFSIESSSPTARVIRPARLFLRLWSMFSSQGEPGARNAL